MSQEQRFETKEQRVATLKVAAQMIIDRAEEIIGSNEVCRGHIITIELLPHEAPVVRTEKEFLVDIYGCTGKYEVVE